MNLEFTYDDIMRLEQRYRAMFINSIGGFKSVVLIGSKNKAGQTNLAIFNSLFHVGANPPLVGFIIRPDSVERHTLRNILETGVFTINHIHESFFIQAHQTSARYPKEISEFKEANLSEELIENYYAPFVKESAIKISATFEQKINVEINGTVLLIAKVNYISLPRHCLLPDGFVDIEKAGTITCSGLDSYHSTKKIARLSYAKPNTWPEII